MGLLSFLGGGSIYTKGNDADVNLVEDITNPSEVTEYLGITSRETLGVNTQGSLSRTCQLGVNSGPSWCSPVPEPQGPGSTRGEQEAFTDPCCC